MTIHEISFAQPNINWAVFSQHTEGVLVRTGQGAYEDYYFRKHYANALEWGKLRGLWHFHQPEQTGTQQVGGFLSIYNSLLVRPKRVYLDVEDIVYDTYDNQGDVTGHVNIKPPSKEFHTLALMQWCDTFKAAAGNELGFYTRADYWNTWVIPSNTDFWYQGVKYRTPDWGKHPLWIASWYNYVPGLEPRLPRDFPTYDLHQYEGGTGRAPGVTYYDGVTLSPIDYNRFNGTYEQSLVYFAGGEIVPVPPSEFETYVVEVTAYFLAVATGPGTNYPSANIWLKKGDRVIIVEEKNGWGRCAEGWISLYYTKRISVTSPPVPPTLQEQIDELDRRVTVLEAKG